MIRLFDFRIFKMALVAAVGFMAGAAKADVMSTSTIVLSNLLFSHTGGAVLSATEFSAFSATNNATATASFGGPVFGGPASGTPLDLPPACAGPGCPAFAAIGPENSFTHLLPPVLVSFAAADQVQSGSPITGTGLPLGATIATGAWAQTAALSPGAGTALSNDILTFFFTPTLLLGGITIDFDADYFHNVYRSAGDAGTARSVGTVDFELYDVTTGLVVFDFAPAELNWNDLLSGPAGMSDVVIAGGATGHFSFTTSALAAGDNYRLTVTVDPLAEAQSVPEPATLVLMGASMLGLAFTRWKRAGKRGIGNQSGNQSGNQ